MPHSSRSDEWEGKPPTPAQQTLETALRAWRKAEAAKSGKPAFIVFGDSALQALVRAAPRTIPELLTVSGFGPDKAERYGAAIIALIRGETPAHSPSDGLSPPAPRRELPATSPTPSVRASSAHRRPAGPPDALSQPQAFTRPSRATEEPTALTSPQLVLEASLRAWRKAEAEKLGLPQFFVLATSTLHAIVLQHPRTLNDLQSIPGISPEKLDKLGPAILALCRP